MGNIFSRKSKSNDEKKEPVDIIVEKYLKNKNINIPFIPKSIESIIYKTVLDNVLNEFLKTLDSLNFSFFNQKISLKYNKISLIDSLIKNKNRPKNQCNEKYLNSMLNYYISKNNIGFEFEKYIYQNIILLVNAVFIEILKTLSINIFNQQFNFTIKNFDSEKKTPFIENDDKTNKFIDNLVNKFLESNNIFVVPDCVERKFYEKCFSFSYFLLRNILNDMNISIMYHNIHMNIESI